MIKSMTGFGRGQSPSVQGHWVVELRTLNSRFLDFHLRLPPGAAAVEERIKKHLSAGLSRGRVNISLSASGGAGSATKLVLNRQLVQEYRRVLEELRQELGIEQKPGLMPFLSNRDLILAEEQGADQETLWTELLPALDQALEQVQAMRAVEGQTLAKDLAARLEVVAGLFEQAASRSPEVVESYRQRLEERLARIMPGQELDPQRLAQEVAILADKCDISEEAVRAASHVSQFGSLLESDEPVGRKLDFLLQELNREANTMGSKTPDAEAGQIIVDLKAELERIREQVQNIE